MLVSAIPEIAAARFGERPCLRMGETVWTYNTLRDRSRRLSNALLTIAKPGERVAILAENCLEYAQAYFGVPGAGMGLVFLNYRLGTEELAWIIGHAAPSVLIVEDKYQPLIESIADRLPSVRVRIGLGSPAPWWMPFDALLAQGHEQEPGITVDESSLAWLLYTSGTTGLPKGAMLSHGNIVAGVLNYLVSAERRPEALTMLLTFPMYHVAGSALLINALRGYSSIMLRNFDVPTLFRLIEEHGAAGFSAAPTMLAMMLDHPLRAEHDLSSLTYVDYGAAPMPAALLRRARQEWPALRFSTSFAMTELSGAVTMLTSAEHDRADEAGLPILASVGRSNALSEVRVVNEAMADQPPGLEGEILVRGDQVLAGYWNAPEATADSFSGAWFHTGDVGRFDGEGYLYIVDRKKDMIVSGGENIYPREIEEVLHRHPAVAEAAVIGIEDAMWGEAVAAIIVAKPGHDADPAEIAAFCRQSIASYKKPRAVGFVAALPRNASGKVLKRELRRMVADGELPVTATA